MAINYQILSEQHAGAYRRLRLEALQTHPDCFATRYQDASCLAELFFEKQIREQSADNIMLGAFCGGQLVGIGGLISIENNHWSLVQMYVQPHYQGRGLSQGLLSKAKALLTPYQRCGLTLTVYEKNDAAIRAYSRAGFVATEKSGQAITMCYVQDLS